MHNFKKIKVWQKSMDLSTEIYKVTMAFPMDEKFGLTSQMRRCSVSIPSNIAEGSGKSTEKDFCSYLSHALASSFELETQLIISNRLKLMTTTEFVNLTKLVTEVQKMIVGLQRSVNNKTNNKTVKS